MKIYKILFAFLIIILFANPLLAVDGYKDIKFGVTLKEFKKNKLCSSWINGGDFLNIRDVRVIYCAEFDFNGKSHYAAAYFIDKKFLRLSIMLKNYPYNNKVNILAALKKKYGPMSREPSFESVKNFEKWPDQQIWYGFDDNTVYLFYKSNEFYKKTAGLVYTSKSYQELLKKKQINSMMDDL